MGFKEYRIMIKLPFKMNFIFDFAQEDIELDIFANLIFELQEFDPFPNVKIYIHNPDVTKTLEDSIFNQIPYELNIVFSDNLEIDNLSCENCNFVCSLVNIDKVLNFLENNPNLNFKNIIINHSERCLSEDSLKVKLNIINDINLPNAYLEPYLTDKEIKNYYINRKQNRGFLSCAACWLTPIIKANGDVYCCKWEKIGNLKEDSFFSIWNSDDANKIRSAIINQKQLAKCNSCNLFYKDNFLIVEDCELVYKDVVYQFPSELNYLSSAPKVIITEYKKINNKHYLVNLFPIFSDKEMINNCKGLLFVLK